MSGLRTLTPSPVSSPSGFSFPPRSFFFDPRPARSGRFFFFNDTATTEIYSLSLHDALPIFESAVLFHGIEGYLDLELWGEDRSKAGSVLPCFYSRSGEPLVIPESFVPGVKAAVRGVACVGCSHSHFLVPRQAPVEVAGGGGLPAARCGVRHRNLCSSTAFSSIPPTDPSTN